MRKEFNSSDSLDRRVPRGRLSFDDLCFQRRPLPRDKQLTPSLHFPDGSAVTLFSPNTHSHVCKPGAHGSSGCLRV